MFVIVPLCMVFYYGLTDKSGAFTLDNILAIATAEHSKALWEALKLSVISTVICLLLAYPLAMILCNMNVNQNSFLVLIFILPMWMNFLLRTLAWQTLLEKTGVINSILSTLHLPALNIINTQEERGFIKVVAEEEVNCYLVHQTGYADRNKGFLTFIPVRAAVA